MNVRSFLARKRQGKKISMVTCYDASFARVLNETEVDCLLVGDSLAMVIYGYPTTVHATLEMMVRHTEAVRRGAPDKMIIADMPFLSMQQGKAHAVHAAGELIRAGADAVKVEGWKGIEEEIAHLVQAGIPVMGHLGLTPQFYYAFGGFRVQGRDEASRTYILEGAGRLEALGCFGIVLECIPSGLARVVTERISIPTIGIGAGSDTDGQVLVLYDLGGVGLEKPFRFVRRYAEVGLAVKEAVDRFVEDVVEGRFPTREESFEDE